MKLLLSVFVIMFCILSANALACSGTITSVSYPSNIQPNTAFTMVVSINMNCPDYGSYRGIFVRVSNTNTGWCGRRGITQTGCDTDNSDDFWNGNADMYVSVPGLSAGSYKFNIQLKVDVPLWSDIVLFETERNINVQTVATTVPTTTTTKATTTTTTPTTTTTKVTTTVQGVTTTTIQTQCIADGQQSKLPTNCDNPTYNLNSASASCCSKEVCSDDWTCKGLLPCFAWSSSNICNHNGCCESYEVSTCSDCAGVSPTTTTTIPSVTTTTIPTGTTGITSLVVSPLSMTSKQNVNVNCKATKSSSDLRTLHLDIRLKSPSDSEILDSGNLGNGNLDVNYVIQSNYFTSEGSYKVICNLRETRALQVDPLIEFKDAIISYQPTGTTTTIPVEECSMEILSVTYPDKVYEKSTFNAAVEVEINCPNPPSNARGVFVSIRDDVTNDCARYGSTKTGCSTENSINMFSGKKTFNIELPFDHEYLAGSHTFTTQLVLDISYGTDQVVDSKVRTLAILIQEGPVENVGKAGDDCCYSNIAGDDYHQACGGSLTCWIPPYSTYYKSCDSGLKCCEYKCVGETAGELKVSSLYFTDKDGKKISEGYEDDIITMVVEWNVNPAGHEILLEPIHEKNIVYGLLGHVDDHGAKVSAICVNNKCSANFEPWIDGTYHFDTWIDGKDLEEQGNPGRGSLTIYKRGAAGIFDQILSWLGLDQLGTYTVIIIIVVIIVAFIFLYFFGQLFLMMAIMRKR